MEPEIEMWAGFRNRYKKKKICSTIKSPFTSMNDRFSNEVDTTWVLFRTRRQGIFLSIG
jgi:hypothetical protein